MRRTLGIMKKGAALASVTLSVATTSSSRTSTRSAAASFCGFVVVLLGFVIANKTSAVKF